MANEYGLDYKYFQGKLKLVVRDADRYTPMEMYRELSRLADTAKSQAIDTAKGGESCNNNRYS